MKKVIILGLLALMSCTMEKRMDRKIRRAERKIENLTIKYPQLLQKDTLYDTFNIVTPTVKYDTSFIDKAGDTTYIYKDKLRIKYVRTGDTTYIEGECKGDTIIQTVEIPIERIVVRKQTFEERFGRFFKFSWILVVIVLLLYLAVRGIFRLMKPF